MEDFKRHRAAGQECEQEKSASEQTTEPPDLSGSQQDQSSQQEAPNNAQNYSYDEYDSYSPWG